MATDLGTRTEALGSPDICDAVPRYPFAALVVGTFLLGWILGTASLYKLWSLSPASWSSLMGGWGYVTFMLVPLCTGILVTRACSRLAARGWAWPSIKWVLIGITAGFFGFLSV